MYEQPATPDLVELTRRLVEAFDGGDVDAIIDLGVRDPVLQASAIGLTFEGRQAIRAFLEDWFAAFEDLAFALQEVHDLGGDVVCAVIRQSGRPLGTTGHVQMLEAWVLECEQGLVARTTAYTDLYEARAAAQRLAESSRDAGRFSSYGYLDDE